MTQSLSVLSGFVRVRPGCCPGSEQPVVCLVSVVRVPEHSNTCARARHTHTGTHNPDNPDESGLVRITTRTRTQTGIAEPGRAPHTRALSAWCSCEADPRDDRRPSAPGPRAAPPHPRGGGASSRAAPQDRAEAARRKAVQRRHGRRCSRRRSRRSRGLWLYRERQQSPGIARDRQPYHRVEDGCPGATGAPIHATSAPQTDGRRSRALVGERGGARRVVRGPGETRATGTGGNGCQLDLRSAAHVTR